jgi:hypothetical protein
MNPIYIAIAIAIAVMLVVRVAAPRVAARWPGSWADVLLAFLLRLSSDWLGALIGLAQGQGATGALVPSPDLDAVAQRAYEAYGTALDWLAHSGNPIPPWADLPAERRQGWYVVASALQAGTSRPSKPPPSAVGVLPLGLLAMVFLASQTSCTPEQAKTAASIATRIAGAACSLVSKDSKEARFACDVIDEASPVIGNLSTAETSDFHRRTVAHVEVVVPVEQADAFAAANGAAK